MNAAEPTGEDPRTSVLSDDDWRRVLALARRHGFDPRGEYDGLLFPESGESGALGIAAAQELAVALSEALREETAPGGEGTGEASGDATGEGGIRVGPPGEPSLQVEWATVRGVGEVAESGLVTISRLP
jgi:hypothetical protein